MEEIGIYIHIPFCVRRCHYCDFYSTTCLNRQEEYVTALLVEAARIPEDAIVRTVYIGGGTPSTLSPKQIARILGAIKRSDIEVTMEANPGDLTLDYLRAIRAAGVNRLSIGIQSFDDNLLRRIGRRHTSAEAIKAVRHARQVGFDNLSIDLIYGLPGQTIEGWRADIEQAIALAPEHISCYCLSYEEGTVLTRQLEDGEITETDEETERTMYELLCHRLREAGYEHYEVSNFALPGRYSRHNSSYWEGIPYIGLGAAAHSFDGTVRSWNPSDLDTYISGTLARSLYRESETLTPEEKHEEAIMLGLRTNKGIEESLVQENQPINPSTNQPINPSTNQPIIEQYIESGHLRREGDRLIATLDGIHILNTIITDLI